MNQEPCFDCPRHCGAVRPERLPEANAPAAVLPGVCHSPLEPVVARAGLHFWEEPVISGTRGSGAVFFSGCNLHCVFCQNYGISTDRQGRQITVARLREIYRELIAEGAHNINLVTPTHFTRAIAASLDEPLPVPVVYNTNGYDAADKLRQLENKVQIYLPDLKYADNELGRRYSAVPDYFESACAAIDEMFRQTGPYRIGEDGMMRSGVIIRHLILPGHIANSLKVIEYVRDRFRPGDVMLSLMRQYIPCGRVLLGEYPELNRKLTFREYNRVKDALFRSGIEDGFFQSGKAASTEFIPSFDGSGV